MAAHPPGVAFSRLNSAPSWSGFSTWPHGTVGIVRVRCHYHCRCSVPPQTTCWECKWNWMTVASLVLLSQQRPLRASPSHWDWQDWQDHSSKNTAVCQTALAPPASRSAHSVVLLPRARDQTLEYCRDSPEEIGELALSVGDWLAHRLTWIHDVLLPLRRRRVPF